MSGSSNFIIVDGIITNLGLADLAPDDIERVEVIKGAAASSLYGSNAANGVVQVFTKRGQSLPDGGLRVTARFELGTNNMPKKMAKQLASLDSLQFSLSGRNLLVFSEYSGLDPEVSNFGNQPLGRFQDVTPYPPSRTYFISIISSF